LQGGKAIRIPMAGPDYAFDWNQVRDAIGPQTRLLLINSPHNPTGRILSEADFEALKELLASGDFLILSDEVYEHMAFDGQPHRSLCTDPELASRTMVVGSFGKNLHITGWKIGWCIAPAALSVEFRKVHQYLTFSTATPLQFALQNYLLPKGGECLKDLASFYEEKRNTFASAMQNSRFRRIPSQGTYFELYGYEEISELPDTEFCLEMTRIHGVAAIPVSVFYEDKRDEKVIRFCFAKSDELLKQATEKLCQI